MIDYAEYSLLARSRLNKVDDLLRARKYDDAVNELVELHVETKMLMNAVMHLSETEEQPK